jgi:hypothetical protein
MEAFYVVSGVFFGHVLFNFFSYSMKSLSLKLRNRNEANQQIMLSGSNGLLESNGIPRPEYLMVNMLALKIAAMAEVRNMALGESTDIKIPLSEDSFINIWYYPKDARSRRVEITIYKGNTGTGCELTDSEEKIILTQLDDLLARTARLFKERRAQASSNASLDALTAML